jgi:hypothetical protein
VRRSGIRHRAGATAQVRAHNDDLAVMEATAPAN